MLPYIKSFCVAVFVILSLAIWHASSLFKDSYVEAMIDHSAHSGASMLSAEYVDRVWNRYYPVLEYISNLDQEEWSSVPHFRIFEKESRAVLSGHNIINVKIMDSKGRLLFQQNRSRLQGEENELIGQGLKREKSHLNYEANISHTTIFNALYDSGDVSLEKDITISEVPLMVTSTRFTGRDGVEEEVEGKMVIYYDMSEMVVSMEHIRVMILSIVVSLIALTMIVIVIVSRRTNRLLETQHEKGIELQNARKEAERQSQAKGRFIANVSHELRTPLNAIIGFSEIIDSESMGPIGNPQYKEFIHDIHTSGKHLLGLINDILDYSKAEEQKLELELQEIDVTKIIQTSIRIVSGRAQEVKVELNTTLPEEHILITGDAKRLKQVLLNLLSNAVKFTNEGGNITIKAWKDENSLMMEVKDTGVGMKAQDISRALSPFGQVDSELSGKHDGTGLGLPLTKKLVELMGGKFELRSEVGLGTHAHISLPIRSPG